MGGSAQLGPEDPIKVANSGTHDYYVGARDYGRVYDVAAKCVVANFGSRLFRPFHLAQLHNMVTATEAPAVDALEDSLQPNEELIVGRPLHGKALANRIILTKLVHTGETE